MESANVVGYTTIPNLVPNQFYLVAAQFQDVGASNIDLQSFIKSSDMTGPDAYLGGTDDDAPILKVWEDGGYVDYYYYAQDWLMNQNVWCAALSGMAVDGKKINLSQGAFLKVKNQCTVQIAGQVASGNTLQIGVQPNVYNLIANPFPIALNLNGNKVAWADALVGADAYAGEGDDVAPMIKTWVDGGYVDYYFYSTDWMMNNNVWCQALSGMTAGDIIIDVSTAFWLKYQGSAVNILFTK